MTSSRTLLVAASLAASCFCINPATAGDHHGHKKYRTVQGYILQPSTTQAAVVQIQGVVQAPTAAAAPSVQSNALMPSAVAPAATQPLFQMAPMAMAPAATNVQVQMVPMSLAPMTVQPAQLQMMPAQTTQFIPMGLAPTQTFHVAQVQTATLVPMSIAPAATSPSMVATPATFLLPHHCLGLFHK